MKYLIYVLIHDKRLVGVGSKSEGKRERKRNVCLALYLTRKCDSLSGGMLSFDLRHRLILSSKAVCLLLTTSD